MPGHLLLKNQDNNSSRIYGNANGNILCLRLFACANQRQFRLKPFKFEFELNDPHTSTKTTPTTTIEADDKVAEIDSATKKNANKDHNNGKQQQQQQKHMIMIEKTIEFKLETLDPGDSLESNNNNNNQNNINNNNRSLTKDQLERISLDVSRLKAL